MAGLGGFCLKGYIGDPLTMLHMNQNEVKGVRLAFSRVSHMPITAGVASVNFPSPPSALMTSCTILPSYLTRVMA